MTAPEDRQAVELERRARAHTFATGAAAVVAVGSVPLFGWPTGVAMALVSLGNLTASRALRAQGRISTTAWALMGIGVVGFAGSAVFAVVHLAH